LFFNLTQTVILAVFARSFCVFSCSERAVEKIVFEYWMQVICREEQTPRDKKNPHRILRWQPVRMGKSKAPTLSHDEPIDSVEVVGQHALKMGWLEKEAEESMMGGWSKR